MEVLLERQLRLLNYLSVLQLLLKSNVFLEQPLQDTDFKPVYWKNHWGTIPAINFAYSHVSRVASERQQRTLFICGPGHGAPALNAQAFLDGALDELYGGFPRNLSGVLRLAQRYSYPGGSPSHAGPDLPGCLHEGGELGYALGHAFGAALDTPDLVVVCLLGDGECETAPTQAAWQSTAFLNPARDGAVLPIISLNGAKIHNPTLLSVRSDEELATLYGFYGFEARAVVAASQDPRDLLVHRDMIDALDWAYARIAEIKREAREAREARDTTTTFAQAGPPRWPLILLRTPKGWGGPESIDGRQVVGSWRAHQIPFNPLTHPATHLAHAEQWLRSYGAAEFTSAAGSGELRWEELLTEAQRSDTGHELRLTQTLESLRLAAAPLDLDSAERKLAQLAGSWAAGSLRPASELVSACLAAVALANPHSFRVMCPDEAKSGGLQSLLDAVGKVWLAPPPPYPDPSLTPEGRVMEVLSEHLCEAWLEGYVLTQRHGVFASYEAFLPIVASQLQLHLKWLEMAAAVPWRRPVPALNLLAMSHCWRQVNHISHQNPSVVDALLGRDMRFWDVYYPADGLTAAATLLRCLNEHDRVNILVSGKQPSLVISSDWSAAQEHVARGLSLLRPVPPYGSNASRQCDLPLGPAPGPLPLPLLCVAAFGEVPMLEALGAAELLSEAGVLGLDRIRLVAVNSLRPLDPMLGLDGEEFSGYFPDGVPILWAFHGHVDTLWALLRRRGSTLLARSTVTGYLGRGAEPSTPFGLLMLNEADRVSLALRAVEALRTRPSESGVPIEGVDIAEVERRWMAERLSAQEHIAASGLDRPEQETWTPRELWEIDRN